MLGHILKKLHDGSFVSALPPFVEGLALAGSYARGTPMPSSDLDLFVILENSSNDLYRDRIEQILALLPEATVRRGPVPVAHFGDSVTLLYQDGTLVQLNFNTKDSIEINPMRRSSRALLDRSGFYAQLIEAAHHCTTDPVSVYREYSDWFVIRACYALNSLQKGELLKATAYLHDMRTALAQLVRLGTGRYDQTRGPYLPLSRFEEEVGQDAAERIGALLPTYSTENVKCTLIASCQEFERLQSAHAEEFSYSPAAVGLLRGELTKWAVP